MDDISIVTPNERPTISLIDEKTKRNGEKRRYDEKAKEATFRYRKAHQHSISVSYTDYEWENDIYPAIQKTGEPVATFIKKAVRQRIANENL